MKTAALHFKLPEAVEPIKPLKPQITAASSSSSILRFYIASVECSIMGTMGQQFQATGDTRDFPFIWEEMTIRFPFGEDHERAEKIILDSVRKHTTDPGKLNSEPIKKLEEKYLVEIEKDLEPRVFYQLTDKGVELTARFIVHDSDGREIKDPISRDLLKAFRQEGIKLNINSSANTSD